MTDYTITRLDISSQGLIELPDDLHLYTNLTHLDCQENKMTSFDGVFFLRHLLTYGVV